jgi:ABC-type polysaccharide/polyol phosphate transport system ATPase subunit
MAALTLHGVKVDFPLFFAGDRSFTRNFLAALTGRRPADQCTTVSALDDVTLTITAGARIALLGGNAAGKTTLLRVMGGLLVPSAGNVAIDGRAIGVLGTGIGIDPAFTPRQTIIGQGLLMGFSLAACQGYLARAVEFGELKDILDQPLNTLAQGHQVRLALSIAVGYAAEILLIDEMLEHLPPPVIDRLFKHIEMDMSQGSIVVIAERSKSLLERVCNRGMVLHRGRLIDSGSFSEIAARHHAQLTG